MVNRAIAMQNTRRAPIRSASQPLKGMPMATVMRYAVMVMFTSAAGTWKSPAMLGMAVVRIVPSRNSIKKVAATSNARRGFHTWLVLVSVFGALRAAIPPSCHRRPAPRPCG